MNHGPNVTKLIIQFMGREVVPPGGGIANVVNFFNDSELRKNVLEISERKALETIEAIKSAPDNPYGTDPEVIAGA